MCGVNHHIPLIDKNKWYHYHLPRCPDSMKVQLMEKITCYTRAGWWESVQTDHAAPMLCIPKKSRLLRTAIDARKRNDNTVKDVTPFPDQDQICLDVARAKIRLKIDFSVYEQIHTVPEDVHKSAFATIYGTYVSHTMQIGDCNAPTTFQCVMTMIFQDFIGIFLHAYLDLGCGPLHAWQVRVLFGMWEKHELMVFGPISSCFSHIPKRTRTCHACNGPHLSKLMSHTSHINKQQMMVENNIMARSRPFSKQYISF